jgi:hypothetical protein
LLDQIIVEFAAALISGEGIVAIGRSLKRVPADQHRTRLLGPIKLQQAIGKAENGAGRVVAIAQNIFRKRMIGAMRERIAVDDQQWPTRLRPPAVHLCFRRFHRKSYDSTA